MTLRIGHGLDAHRLVEGRPLMLGCVHVPHGSGLAGHSDGDVVTHALCDAILGAAALGDMGRHFPSSEERWRGTPGADFLTRVADLLAGVRLRVVSAQVVVVAERPRLAAHLATMAEHCSSALRAVPGTVQVSATTTDGMGFAGRGEGIAASAVAIVDDA